MARMVRGMLEPRIVAREDGGVGSRSDDCVGGELEDDGEVDFNGGGVDVRGANGRRIDEGKDGDGVMGVDGRSEVDRETDFDGVRIVGEWNGIDG